MYLEKNSFDAVITDKNGSSIEVDCQVTEPAASGLAAQISIEIPLGNDEMIVLENPCSLHGSEGGFEIEMQKLWYRSISAGVTRRKHARGVFEINYIGQLWVRRKHWTSERGSIKFLLSPIRLFKKHTKARAVDYASTPRMTTELFRLQTVELGEIRLIMFWSVHRVDNNEISAEIRSSFAAEIQYDGTSPIDSLVGTMKDVLIPLSILARQAITLHGWIWEKRDGIQTMWFEPLEPNLAPDMAEMPLSHLCTSQEFEKYAQIIVENFLQALPEKKEAIVLLSGALVPHVKRSIAESFLALFGALEEIIALNKLTREEKAALRKTDEHLIKALMEKKLEVESTLLPDAQTIAARLEGFANSVNGRGPSFKSRFEKFKAAHPAISDCLSDLWPLQGSDNQPGLKQIRDSLAHGLRDKYSHQAIAIAHWHFARLVERLVFIILNIDVPQGITPDSALLRRDPWYKRGTWRDAQISARCLD